MIHSSFLVLYLSLNGNPDRMQMNSNLQNLVLTCVRNQLKYDMYEKTFC